MKIVNDIACVSAVARKRYTERVVAVVHEHERRRGEAKKRETKVSDYICLMYLYSVLDNKHEGRAHVQL